MRIVNLRDSYRFYQKHSEHVVDIKVYIGIILDFLKFLVQKIHEGKDVKLPCELGTLGIRGRKVRPRLDKDGSILGLAPDWVKTKALWERNEKAKEAKTLVYHFNEHSNGFRYKLVWFKSGMKFKNKSVYSFKLSRKNKRIINKLVKQGVEYTESIAPVKRS